MKIIDQIYNCQLPGQVFGLWPLQCHLRIFQPHLEVQTVMITNMGFEMGWFIPYLVERLIEQVVTEFYLDPAQVIWIEHYTSDFKKPMRADFSLVTFEWHNGNATNPQWTAIAPELVQRLTCADCLPV